MFREWREGWLGAAARAAVRDPAGATRRSAQRRSGKAEKAARAVLVDTDSDHAAADLLTAVAVQLAQDVDQALSVRELVAASRELRELVEALDTVVVPPVLPDVDDDPLTSISPRWKRTRPVRCTTWATPRPIDRIEGSNPLQADRHPVRDQ
jgi:hypothetical protein